MLEMLKNLTRPAPEESALDAYVSKERDQIERLERLLAEAGGGKWMSVGDVHPTTNIFRRLYRDEDGNIRRQSSYELTRATAWFFTE